MTLSGRALVIAALVAATAGIAAWLVVHRRGTPPFAMSAAALSNWALVSSDGSDPWVVGVKPPDALTTQLLKEASRRAGTTLVAPPHPALPLVLRTEFDEGLQGVYGTDSVLRMARDAGIESTQFLPVCLARRTSDGPSGRAEMYFVPFDSPEFYQLRIDITPTEPEHAGIGIYEPGTLLPVLIVGATDNQFDRWWPVAFNRETDCEADLHVTPAQN